jgi:hypothetical protein
MPIIGSSASPKGVPSTPTIGTATAGDGSASVTFTAPSFSKLPITSYTVTASPGGATGTGSSSPIVVSGLSNGTSYTFTVRASHANGQSAASSESNSASPVAPVYALSQTFNASGTYTVPEGKNYVAVYTFGGGGSGGNGNSGINPKDRTGLYWLGGNGGAGGGGGGGVAFQDYFVNPGENYTVTVAGGGGTSSFGNLASANGGGVLNAGSGSSNVSGYVTASGGGGGGGGAGSGENYLANDGIIYGSPGGASGVGQNLALNGLGLTSLQAGGGGGGGGGGRSPGNAPTNSPSSGSSSGGGNGGTAPGGSGNAASANTAGGGGGGAGGNAGVNSNNGGGSGASGGSGKVVVYIR